MRLALLLARRGMRRNLGRSLLIAVLVGVPVAGATMVDVLARTLSAPERDAERRVGAADAQVTVAAQRTLPDFRPTAFSEVGNGAEPERDARNVDIAALLPPGTRVVPAPVESPLRLTYGDHVVRSTLVAADLREPLHRHKARIVEGRAPVESDEALLSPPLADRLDARPGDTIAPVDSAPLTITGIATAPFCHSCEQLAALPGSAPAKQATADEEPPLARYLVDLPPGTNADALWPALARKGVALVPRDAYIHPERYEPPGGVAAGTDDLQAIALTVVIAGLGLLEVVLLAGTAFAVGARRQTRELGLISASGGSARHVRRIVLAQGLVLGVLGAVIGVAAGAALVVGARPLWEHFADGDITGWKFGPLEIAGAALIGLLSGLAAAIIPAIGAGRMRAVDALAERFRTTRWQRRRGVLLGGGLMAAGIICGLAGDRLIAGDFAAYTRALERVKETGLYVAEPTSAGPLALIVGGATLLVAGLVFLAPALIGRLAGVGARLPLSARLAVRDAARHRHRTGPATSAIAVAVAGSVVLAFLLAGSFRADELRHVPPLPPNVLAVEPGDGEIATTARAARLAATELPGGRVYELRQPLRPLAQGERLPTDVPEIDARQIYPVQPQPVEDCAPTCAGSGGPLAVAGDDELNAIAGGGELDSAARDALAAGKVIVFERGLLADDGHVEVELGFQDGDEAPARVRLPGHLVVRRLAYSGLPAALVPERVARAHGWEIETTRTLVRYDAGATRDEVDAALAAAEDLDTIAYIDDPDKQSQTILLVIAAVAGFVTLVGVAISVALSAAEGRADLATLAAVGAPPSRRRALAASQALLVGGLGCALGLAFGAFVAFTARATTGSPDFVVPWANLAVTGIAVPLLAMLVAAVFTPGRLPMVRRVT